MSPSNFNNWLNANVVSVASSGELDNNWPSDWNGVRPVSFVISLLWGLIS